MDVDATKPQETLERKEKKPREPVQPEEDNRVSSWTQFYLFWAH